jgi:hypothetical protein
MGVSLAQIAHFGRFRDFVRRWSQFRREALDTDGSLSGWGVSECE